MDLTRIPDLTRLAIRKMLDMDYNVGLFWHRANLRISVRIDAPNNDLIS